MTDLLTPDLTLDRQSIVLEPGEPLVLDQPDAGHEILSGRVEIYATLGSEAKVSGRHFLFELSRGELIVPCTMPDGQLQLTALAVERTELRATPLADLVAQADRPEQRQALAALCDRWIGLLSGSVSKLADPPPTDAASVAVGESVVEPILTARDGVVWVVGSDVALTYFGTLPVAPATAARLDAAVLAAGLWLTTSSPERLSVHATATILARPEWRAAMAGIHEDLLMLLAGALGARRAAARGLVETRVGQTRHGLQRALGRFDAVLGSTTRHAGAEERSVDEPLVAPFEQVARELGVEFTTRRRDLLARCRTVDAGARAVQLRNRPVALRGDWLTKDYGPLIGFLDEERRPVALSKASGKWRMFEGEDNRPITIDAGIAARIAPMAQMLYPPLPDRPVGLKEFIGFGLARNYGDILLAAAMAAAGALLGLATPLAMQLAFDRFIPGHETVSLAKLAAGLVLAAMIAAGFRVAYDVATLRVDGRSAGTLQAAIMDRVLRLPDYALRMSPGDLASRIAASDTLRRTICSVFLGSISSLFFFLANLGMMFWYSPAAAGLAVALFVFLSLLAVASGQGQLKALMRGEQLLADIYSIVFQFVQGITVLRSSGAEQRAFTRWAMDFAELRARSYRARRIATLWEVALAVFELLALAAILWVVASMPRESISTGVFISFIAAYGAYMGASLQLARGAVAVWNAKPSWTRLAPLLKAVPEGAGLRRDPGTLTGAIDLTGVYFRYGVEAPFALQGLSLSIAPGEFVALVGPSGAGKSTVMRLLLGFEMPISGTVQYDHQDLRFLDLELFRRQIGVVLQNSALFPGTLYENIMGTVDGTMDDAWEAARNAGIEDDIKSMPMGMHTVVTEASSAFSGGQIQRIAIARALVSKPRILLFDEATSAVDNVTQAAITESLERLAVTRLVVAHRLSTVKKAHRIVVLGHGKVEQTGRYEDLVKAPGLFAEIARRQLI